MQPSPLEEPAAPGEPPSSTAPLDPPPPQPGSGIGESRADSDDSLKPVLMAGMRVSPGPARDVLDLAAAASRPQESVRPSDATASPSESAPAAEMSPNGPAPDDAVVARGPTNAPGPVEGLDPRGEPSPLGREESDLSGTGPRGERAAASLAVPPEPGKDLPVGSKEWHAPQLAGEGAGDARVHDEKPSSPLLPRQGAGDGVAPRPVGEMGTRGDHATPRHVVGGSSGSGTQVAGDVVARMDVMPEPGRQRQDARGGVAVAPSPRSVRQPAAPTPSLAARGSGRAEELPEVTPRSGQANAGLPGAGAVVVPETPRRARGTLPGQMPATLSDSRVRSRDAPAYGAVVVEPTDQGSEDGIRAGDVVVSLGGQRVLTAAHLSFLCESQREGDEVELTVWRGGKVQRVLVRLEALSGGR